MPTPQQILTSNPLASGQAGPGVGGILVESPPGKQVLAQSWTLPASTLIGTEFGIGTVTFPLAQRNVVPKLGIWILNASTVSGLEIEVGITDLAPVSNANVTPGFEKFRVRPNNGPKGQGFVCDFVPYGGSLRISARNLAVSEASSVTVSMKAYMI